MWLLHFKLLSKKRGHTCNLTWLKGSTFKLNHKLSYRQRGGHRKTLSHGVCAKPIRPKLILFETFETAPWEWNSHIDSTDNIYLLRTSVVRFTTVSRRKKDIVYIQSCPATRGKFNFLESAKTHYLITAVSSNKNVYFTMLYFTVCWPCL